jgi:hypothetical protein
MVVRCKERERENNNEKSKKSGAVAIHGFPYVLANTGMVKKTYLGLLTRKSVF